MTLPLRRRAAVHPDRAAGRDRHHCHPHRPAAARGPESPRGGRTHGRNNLKQIGLAIHACDQANGYMPQFGCAWPQGSTTLTQCSTFFAILPFMEQTNLYKSLPAGQHGDSPTSTAPATWLRSRPTSARRTPAGSRRAAPGRVGTWPATTTSTGRSSLGQYPAQGRSFTDGTSNTVMYVEHIALCRNPAGGNDATDGRSVWPAVNLTTGDPIIYWTGESRLHPTPASPVSPSSIPR